MSRLWIINPSEEHMGNVESQKMALQIILMKENHEQCRPKIVWRIRQGR